MLDLIPAPLYNQRPTPNGRGRTQLKASQA
jgi:hypothetical protein